MAIKISWAEVQKKWQDDEIKVWHDFYTAKGFSSWEKWRQTYITPLKLANRNWQLRSILTEEILNYYCGAFKGWLEISNTVNSRQFKHLAKAKQFKNNKKITKIKNNFPHKIQLIAVIKNNQTYIIEGNHRCLALSQLLLEDIFTNTSISCAVTKLDSNKKHPFVDYSPNS
jgi:hypothetical protein